ncbi:MAG: ImmA/IrrE family metallo-endopeptidase [Lactobacillus sp.]|nr:MAG: ImmA/IrrE family metallo-endopeptidase [Lactobacillus sp.]
MGVSKQFDGARLKAIREARMMTAKKLSTESGVSTTTISRVEHGGEMSLDVAEKLATALNTRVNVFEGPADDYSSPVYFRSLSAATKTARKAQSARSAMANALLDEFEVYLDFPKFNLSDVCHEKNINALTDGVIDDAALEVRRIWGLDNGPISNLTGVAEANGIVIAMTPFSVDTLDGFSQMGELGRPIVFVNTDKGTAFRWRFDLGHEIGHMVLHQNLEDIAIGESTTNKLLEQQASYFSGALLMPEESFVRSLPGLGINDFLSVKNYWGVSLQAMLYRARNIGILDEQQYAARQVTISKKKWRRHEPFDDQRLPERPTLLRTCTTMCVQQCGIPVQQIMDEAGVPEDIFEDLVGVQRGYVRNGGFEPQVQNVNAKVVSFTNLRK